MIIRNGLVFLLSVLLAGELMACPVSEKQVLYLLMQSHDVSLSVHESCHDVGTEFTDKTIGEFISGFWAYHTETSGSNWIKVRSRPVDKRRCEGVVEIYRRHGEEIIGGWGVSFVFDSRNRKVDRASIRCLGSG